MKHALIAFFCLLSFATVSTPAAFAEDAKPTYTLASQRKSGQTDRVTALMEVGGEFQGADEKPRPVPMSGTDDLVYHEMTLDANSARPRSLRYYEKVKSATRFKDDSYAPTLSDRRRLVGVAVDPPKVRLFALSEPLTQDELGVIDILGNSLILDRLLPEKPVSIGDTWKPAGDVVAALLGLDSATRCDVQCTLKEVTDDVARVEVSGSVEGPVNDTTTTIRLNGKYRFERRIGRIDWLGLVTKENRGISLVADGFDITVRFQMTIAQESPPPQFANDKTAGLDAEADARTRSAQLRLAARQVANRLRPRLASQQQPTGKRRPENDWRREVGRPVQRRLALEARSEPIGLVGGLPAGHPPALGDNFGEFVEAKQSVDAANHRILRVVVQGVARNKAADVPIRWIYYHVADQHGRQVAFTFTVEQERLERFADADHAIVDSLRFAEAGSPK